MLILAKDKIINMSQVAYLAVEVLHLAITEYELVAYYSQIETDNGKDCVIIKSYDTEEAANHALAKIAEAYSTNVKVCDISDT